MIDHTDIPVHQSCDQSIFVDRSDYEVHETITCPLPGCMHVWCKACSQSIDPTGPKHSCDGSSELNHLMTQQGWKNCPGACQPSQLTLYIWWTLFTQGCRTPTSKSEGCNHMTVSSCNCWHWGWWCENCRRIWSRRWSWRTGCYYQLTAAEYSACYTWYWAH